MSTQRTTYTLLFSAVHSFAVQPPPGLQSYTADVDLRPGQDLIARVSAR